jgi:hypothetical protein
MFARGERRGNIPALVWRFGLLRLRTAALREIAAKPELSASVITLISRNSL